MIIELRGLQFVNKGAELMLRAILQRLADSDLNYELAMRHSPKSPKEKVEEVGAFQKITLQKNVLNLNFLTYFIPQFLRRYLKNKFKIVFEADVDVVLDGYGFAYGDQWSSMAIQQLCLEINRLHSHGKKYVFLPQALGPFTREKDVEHLKKALPKAKIICARESESVENIEQLIGNAENVFQFPDFTNIVTGTLPSYFDAEKDVFLIIPNNKMLSTKNNHTEWASRYTELLVFAGEKANSLGCEVIILNHEGVKDDQICIDINDSLSFDAQIIREPDPLNVKGIIGASKGLICSRFHGCVSALSQGVPVIGTSWSFKYEQLFGEYEESGCLIKSSITKKQLSNNIEALLNRKTGTLTEAAKRFKNESHKMWDLVMSAVKE